MNSQSETGLSVYFHKYDINRARGDYASSSEVIREALRDWKINLLTSLQQGIADIKAGRIKDYDIERIITLGRKLSAGRSSSD